MVVRNNAGDLCGFYLLDSSSTQHISINDILLLLYLMILRTIIVMPNIMIKEMSAIIARIKLIMKFVWHQATNSS